MPPRRAEVDAAHRATAAWSSIWATASLRAASTRSSSMADVVGVDGVGADGDVEELHRAGDGDLHRATAGAPGDLGLGRLGLGVHQLALHLHGLARAGR